jgi:hypothetical protein
MYGIFNFAFIFNNIKIINDALKHNNFPRNKKQEMITLINTILHQNYIQHIDQQYKQN